MTESRPHEGGPAKESKRRPALRSLVLLTVLLAGGGVGVWPTLACEGAQPVADIEDLALIPADGRADIRCESHAAPQGGTRTQQGMSRHQ
jgi:hypothetical protein